jgi:hypothetical protein
MLGRAAVDCSVMVLALRLSARFKGEKRTWERCSGLSRSGTANTSREEKKPISAVQPEVGQCRYRLLNINR